MLALTPSHGLRRTLAALAFLAAWPLGSAHADPTDAERAEVLFNEARALVRAGNDADACPKFAESLRLDPAPGTRLNLAACEEKAGHLVHALALLKQATGELPAGDARLALAEQRTRALRARIPRVVLPESTGAHIADVPGVGGVYLLDPGRHTLSIVKAGQVPRQVVVTLVDGDVQALSPDEPFAPPPPPPPKPPSSTQRTAGLVVMGVGIVGLGVGAVTGALALHDKSVVDGNCQKSGVCNDQSGLDAKSHGRTAATLSPVFFAVGGVAATTGIVLFLTAPKRLDIAIVPGGAYLRGEL